MNLLKKVTDALLAKNWIITLLSFIIGVIASFFLPANVYDKLPFDSKVNVIVGFSTITLGAFLLLYSIVWLVSTRHNKAKSSRDNQRSQNEKAEENIEQWRCFFDRINDEEYSILRNL